MGSIEKLVGILQEQWDQVCENPKEYFITQDQSMMEINGDYMSYNPSVRSIYRLAIKTNPVELQMSCLTDSSTLLGDVWELARFGDIILGLVSFDTRSIVA